MNLQNIFNILNQVCSYYLIIISMFSYDRGNDIETQFKTWWKNIPIITYSMLFFLILVWILLMLGIYDIYLVVLSPERVVKYLEIWQLFTYQYQHDSILNLVFILFIYLPIASKTEQKIGTIKFLFFFLINNFVLGLLYVSILYLASFMPTFSYFSSLPNYTCWGITMLELVVVSNKTPDAPTRFCCFPCEFKQKYYPWIFLALFFLLSEFLFIPILFGFMVGYLRIL